MLTQDVTNKEFVYSDWIENMGLGLHQCKTPTSRISKKIKY